MGSEWSKTPREPPYTTLDNNSVVANKDYGLRSFSSQMFFSVAHAKQFISLDKKFELQKALLEFNYEFVSIDALFIFSQLKIANYRPEEISTIISQLVRKETSIQSLGIVLADLLLMFMMDTAILSETKVQIFKHILREASQNHDLTNIEESVFAHLQMKVKTEKHEELKGMVRFLFQGTY